VLVLSMSALERFCSSVASIVTRCLRTDDSRLGGDAPQPTACGWSLGR